MDEPPKELDEIYSRALEFVRRSRITDVEFIYTPSQISLTALHDQAPSVALLWIKAKELDSARLEELISCIKAAVDAWGKPPDVETVREVDRRLRTCKNPEKTIGNPVYETKKAEAEGEKEEKRVSKALKARLTLENEDPFGGSLRNGGQIV